MNVFPDQEIDNLILATDSYKLNHWNQYPKGTQAVYSYFESRQGAEYPYTVFFGLQYLIKKYLLGQAVSIPDVEEAGRVAIRHFGGTGYFNLDGWRKIAGDHYGKLPIRIKAVPEGTVVPTGNVLMTVENTDPDAYWLTNALESLLVHVWYPSTVATLSRHTLERIGHRLDEAQASRDGLPFMLHDFGYRGASSHESAAIGGAAHIVNSQGTDTLPALLLAQKYYGANLDTLAFSVPATEHSIMTAEGPDGERAIVDRLLTEYPTGILSVVGDSYNIERFVGMIGTEFKDRIMARDGKFVVRPDSVRSKTDTPERQMSDLSKAMWSHFGGTTTSTGYKEFDPHVGLLWGDGINPDGIDKILAMGLVNGFSPSNYVFGMGGGLLQKVNRDTQRFAFKCSAQKRNGEWHDVQKDPLDHTKASKAGRLGLIRTHDGGFATVSPFRDYKQLEPNNDLLETVFENGELVNEQSFDDIRKRAAIIPGSKT